MTTPKRKRPDAKRAPKRQPLMLRGANAAGAVVAARPSLFGGTAAFVVIFSFIAANALWYQHGKHPSPIFDTRDISGATIRAEAEQREIEADTTTFKIERQEPADSTAQPVVEDAAAGTETPSRMVMEIQRELARRGLYDGPADGLTGPKTVSAILFFEETANLPADGVASERLLAALKAENSDSAAVAPVVPDERPQGDLITNSTEKDDVASLIAKADTPVPPKDVPVKSADKQKPVKDTTGLVMKIQKGLANIAYSDVSVDGVAGEQTRAAIRHFEKHYRLPVTGEPSEAVLKKLKSIGAL